MIGRNHEQIPVLRENTFALPKKGIRIPDMFYEMAQDHRVEISGRKVRRVQFPPKYVQASRSSTVRRHT